MATIGRSEILLATLSLLTLWLIAGMVLACGWVLYQLLNRRPILPDRPMVNRRPVPWNVGTVLLVILVYTLVSYEMPRVYDLATGRMPVKPSVAAEAVAERKGKPREETKTPIPADPGEANTKAPSKVQAVDGQPRPHQAPAAPAADAKDPQAPAPHTKPAALEPAYSMTEMMAILAMTDLVLLMLLPMLVRMTSGATLRDFGLSFEGWWRQAAVGVVAALAAAPLVYSVQFLAIQIWKNNAHPVQTMLLKEFSPGVAELAILSGVLVAPIFEELMFRGIFQSWLVGLFGHRRPELVPQPRETAIEWAESPAVSRSWNSNSVSWEADSQNDQPSQTTAMPDLALGSRTRSWWPGVVLTSVLFAAVHAAQWPAPIALFLLALVIGTVYHRTGSLIAAVFVHATFNGLSTLTMFITLLGDPTVDANKVKVGRNEAAVIGSQVLRERGWMHRGLLKGNSVWIFLDAMESDC